MNLTALAATLPLAQATDFAGSGGWNFPVLASGGGLLVGLLLLGLSVLVQVVIYWIAAKVVIGEPNGDFENAFKLWVLSVIIGVGMGLIFGGAIFFFLSIGNTAAAVTVGLVAAILSLFLAFMLPMKVFEIGFGRALGFVFISVVLGLALRVGISQLRGDGLSGDIPRMIAILRSPEQREAWVKRIKSIGKRDTLDMQLDRLGSAEERAKPFPERQENLRKVYAILAARQKEVPAHDGAAIAEYERLRDRYEALVQTMRADYAASKGQPAAR